MRYFFKIVKIDQSFFWPYQCLKVNPHSNFENKKVVILLLRTATVKRKTFKLETSLEKKEKVS